MQQIDWSSLKGQKKLFIAADAGGANVLASLVQSRNLKGDFLLAQPAIDIFRIEGISGNVLSESNVNFQEYEFVLSSTGMSNGFEIRMMSRALNSKKRVIAILDHWVNYRLRFTIESSLIRPSGLIVTNEESIQRIDDVFGDMQIYFETNFYLQKQLSQIYSHSEKEIDVLILDERCEPMQERNQVNIAFYSALISDLTSLKPNIKVAIRPHPSRNKPDLERLRDLYVDISTQESLGYDVNRSRSILGLSSMSFYISSISGAHVFSIIPEITRKCLPLKEVKGIDLSLLKELINQHN